VIAIAGVVLAEVARGAEPGPVALHTRLPLRAGAPAHQAGRLAAVGALGGPGDRLFGFQDPALFAGVRLGVAPGRLFGARVLAFVVVVQLDGLGEHVQELAVSAR
jgi:hypothetical protein